MSPDHESSYYEIALTNRQVLTIFVVLLTCLVAAFLSGVWLGRRDGGEAPIEASLGGAAPEPATAQMTELNFFSDGAGTGEERRERRPEAPPAKAEPSSPPPPAAKAPAEKPPSQQAKVEKPPTRPAPEPSTPPAAAGRVIQVFSTPDATQADKLVRRLGDGGYPVFLVEENLQGITTYRVRVGPYAQETRAQKVADELRREYRLDTWITSQPG